MTKSEHRQIAQRHLDVAAKLIDAEVFHVATLAIASAQAHATLALSAPESDYPSRMVPR